MYELHHLPILLNCHQQLSKKKKLPLIQQEKYSHLNMGRVLFFSFSNLLIIIFRPPPDITPIDDLGPYEIRLQNIGCKNRRFDRIVVQRMKHSPNANEIIENLGSYDPMPNDKNEVLVALNLKRLRYWIGTEGVVINPWVQKLLGKTFLFD
jgi:ribosomal protein S16